MPVVPGSAGGVLDTLDAAAVHRWSSAALAGFEAGRAEIDALNVFPVPDGDTGTNMLATLRSAHHVLTDAMTGRASPSDARTALGVLSQGAATGAIGNSGFILSQILRGLAEAAVGPDGWGPDVLRAGLAAGARLGRQAVVTPVEGTILTVARAAADAAGDLLAAPAATLAEVASAAVRAAAAAVQRTPSLLPDLAEAGVVDAGGRGLLVLLHALSRTIGGDILELAPVQLPARGGRRVPARGTPRFGYEVQYLLDLPATGVDALRGALDRVGESVALVPAGPAATTWKVHVHVEDVGAAIEAAFDHGRPRRIEVVGLSEVDERRPGEGVAVVAIAPGAGLAHLFSGEGVHVVEGGDTDTSGDGDVDDVVAAIRASRARDVVLLPNASRVNGVAEAAADRARAQGLRVTVVPTRSPVQGLAAVAVHDPSRRFDDNVVAMAEAAAATRFAEVTVARSRALTAVGLCDPGDVLGLIDGEVVEVGRGLLAVAFGLVDRLVGVGAELMTVLVGEGAPERTGALIEAHVRGRAPLTDVTVYQGGQPEHPVIIGVE